MNEKFKILTLDGGGAKGIFTLGILYEIEAYLKGNLDSDLNSYFDLFYGTSTGSIIASMINLGYDIKKIKSKYLEMLPLIMKPSRSKMRSSELKNSLEKEFKEKKFIDFPKPIGIVATNLTKERPLIFKNSSNQASGSIDTFNPGFGCTIAEAIEASCSAYPLYFHLKNIRNEELNAELVDGGYIANNPSLFAIIDAVMAYKKDFKEIKLMNIGTGTFIDKKSFLKMMLGTFSWLTFIGNVFQANSRTSDIILENLCNDVQKLRIDAETTNEKLKTNLMECDKDKLEKLFSFGRETFSKHENEIKEFLKN